MQDKQFFQKHDGYYETFDSYCKVEKIPFKIDLKNYRKGNLKNIQHDGTFYDFQFQEMDPFIVASMPYDPYNKKRYDAKIYKFTRP